MERSDSVPDVLTFFQLGTAKKVTPLTSGMANPSFVALLENDNQFVVKFLQNQTPTSVDNEVAIQEQLKQAGIPGIFYIRNPQGQYLFHEDGTYSVASQRVEGVHPQEGRLETCLTMGRAMARFHTAIHELPNPQPAWLSPERVAQELPNLSEHELFDQITRLTAVGKTLHEAGLPRGVIHGDLCTSNILVDEEDPTVVKAIFDFEEAENNLLVIDIARTAWDICIPKAGEALDDNLLKAFMYGYSTIRQVTEAEQSHLKDALTYTTGAMLIWFIQNGYPDRTQQILSQWQKTFEQ